MIVQDTVRSKVIFIYLFKLFSLIHNMASFMSIIFSFLSLIMMLALFSIAGNGSGKMFLIFF